MQDSLKTQKRTKKVSNIVKDENGEYHLVKTEVPFTPEAFSLKGEGNHDDEIQVIDYNRNEIPDFTKVPEEIIKNEMQRNGYKTCQVKKSTMYQFLGEIWNYRKMGKVPEEYLEE